MSGTKLFCKFVCSFTYYFQLLDKPEVYNMIILYLFRCMKLQSFVYVIDCLQHVLQALFVSNRLSHKSLFYHG